MKGRIERKGLWMMFLLGWRMIIDRFIDAVKSTNTVKPAFISDCCDFFIACFKQRIGMFDSDAIQIIFESEPGILFE